MADAAAVISTSHAGTGAGTAAFRKGSFNFSLSGTFSATVAVERSYDDGSTFHIVESFTTPVERVCFEAEDSVQWRSRCTAFVSGPAVARFGGSLVA